MDALDRQFEIERQLGEKGLSPMHVDVSNTEVEIRICGDWKHTHRYMDYIMTLNGYTYTGFKNEVTDSDWGCYTHIYTFNK